MRRSVAARTASSRAGLGVADRQRHQVGEAAEARLGAGAAGPRRGRSPPPPRPTAGRARAPGRRRCRGTRPGRAPRGRRPRRRGSRRPGRSRPCGRPRSTGSGLVRGTVSSRGGQESGRGDPAPDERGLAVVEAHDRAAGHAVDGRRLLRHQVEHVLGRRGARDGGGDAAQRRLLEGGAPGSPLQGTRGAHHQVGAATGAVSRGRRRPRRGRPARPRRRRRAPARARPVRTARRGPGPGSAPHGACGRRRPRARGGCPPPSPVPTRRRAASTHAVPRPFE